MSKVLVCKIAAETTSHVVFAIVVVVLFTCAIRMSKRQRLSLDPHAAVPYALAKTSRLVAARLLAAAKDDAEASSSIEHNALNKALQQVQKDTQVVLRVRKRSGEPYEWHVCEAAAALQFLLGSSESLQRTYAEALERRPSTCGAPWRAIISFDEFTPGAQVTGRHERKFMHLVLNFLELGAQFLTVDDGWVSIVVMLQRSKQLAYAGASAQSRQLSDIQWQRAPASYFLASPIKRKAKPFSV